MSRKLIFVVDDDALSRDFLTEATRAMGHDVQAFEQADLAIQASERRVPDLVLSDVRMPGMDGMQLTRVLQDRYPGLPVVLVTARGSDADKQRGVQAGANAYIVKGNFEQQHLLETVAQLI